MIVYNVNHNRWQSNNFSLSLIVPRYFLLDKLISIFRSLFYSIFVSQDEGIAESDSLFNSLIKLYLLYGNAEESDMESEGYRYEVDSSDISVIRRAS